MSPAEFHQLLVELSKDAGFALASGVDIETTLSGEFRTHVQRYDAWLENGHHGAMNYLERGRDRRADPREVFPDAKSVFCVAVPYRCQPAGVAQASQGGRYARYIDGPDYHDWIAEKLEAVMLAARERDADLKWKICVDTSAVLERSWAALAGLGWIGKNTLLIHPKLGSYLFLGEVLINRSVGHGPRPIANLCGHCERCLHACPTSAFPRAGTLDSQRCISYWTLEKRGEIPLAESEKAKFGTWLGGCDICQEVCPFNIKPSREAETTERSASDLSDWSALLDETADAYRARVRDSALSRVKPEQFSRNLAIALRNALRENAMPELHNAILRRASDETDPAASAEWKETLQMSRGH